MTISCLKDKTCISSRHNAQLPSTLVALLAPAVMVLCGALSGQLTSIWIQRKPITSPPGVHRHAMCFDPIRKVAVLFGGGSANTGSSLYATTWEWNGSNWTKKTPKTSPPKRHLFGMAFCPTLKASLVFGGHDYVSVDRNDTWIWKGTIWTKLSPTTSPSARRSHLLASDTKRGKVVLFGGNSGGTLLNDTWEWDGKTWTKMSPKTNPPMNHGYGFAYDESRQVTVMFGGHGAKGTTNETWEWDGNNWTRKLPKTSPSARGNNWMVFDSVRQQTVLFGGSFSDETWTWDGVNWVRLNLNPRPPGRDAHAMVFDDVRNEVLLFGGIRTRNDTWSLIKPGFSTYGTGCAGLATPPSLGAPSRPTIGKPFTLRISNLKPLAGGVVVLGTSSTSWSGAPLPLDLTLMGMQGCKLLTSWEAEAAFFSKLGGSHDWIAAIPNTATLIGFTFFCQAWVLDAKANWLGIATSNGGKGMIGR